MKYHFLTIMAMTAIIWSAVSQKRIEPSDEDILLAESLKTTYEDDHVAITKSSDHITFDLDSRNGLVIVKHHASEDLINLDSRSDIQVYSFYNGESEIEEMNILYKNGKNAEFYFSDEAYTSEDLFHNDVRVKYAQVDFPLRGYRYTAAIELKYKDIKYFTKVFFNDEYPIVEKEIIIEVPKWLEIEFKEMNFEDVNIEKSVKVSENGKYTIHTYRMRDIPAQFKEDNTPGPTYIYPHLLVLPKSFEKNGNTQNIFNSTDDLYSWYKSLTDQLTNDTNEIKSKVADLTSGPLTDNEKLKNIHYSLQDNI